MVRWQDHSVKYSLSRLITDLSFCKHPDLTLVTSPSIQRQETSNRLAQFFQISQTSIYLKIFLYGLEQAIVQTSGARSESYTGYRKTLTPPSS